MLFLICFELAYEHQNEYESLHDNISSPSFIYSKDILNLILP